METLARRATQQFGAQALQPSQVTAPADEPFSGPDGLGGPRLVKGMFSVATSSSKPPTEIAEEVQRILAVNNVEFARDQFLFQCRYREQNLEVRFTIEICRIQALPLFGLHLKKISGEVWAYSGLCNHLTSQMKL